MGTIENINVQMNTSKEVRCFYNWHESALQVIGDECHIVQDGILNKKDYSLVFETENGKREIPVGVVEQINIYSDAAVTLIFVWEYSTSTETGLPVSCRNISVMGVSIS